MNTQDENEQHLIRLYRENQCGDVDCEGRRYAAVQTVLKGWITHADAADALRAEAHARSLAEPATETVRRLAGAAVPVPPSAPATPTEVTVGAPIYDKVAQTVSCPACKAVRYHVTTAKPRPFTLSDDDDEEMTPHAYVPHNGDWVKDIWCRDCAYHRDHEVHAAAAVARAAPQAEHVHEKEDKDV